MYQLDLRYSIVDIPLHEWNKNVSQDDPLWSWYYFLAMEKSHVGPDHYEYLCIYEGEELIGILPAFVFRRFPLEVGSHQFFSVPVYFCGHPMGRGSLLTRIDCPQELIQWICQVVTDQAKKNKLSWIFFKDFCPTDELFEKAPASFFRVRSLPDTVIALGFESFEEYLNHLKPKARRNIRYKNRRFYQSDDLSLEVLNDFQGMEDDVQKLYENVMRRAKVKLDRLNLSFFKQATRLQDVVTRVVTVFGKARQPLAFALFLMRGKEAYCLRVGFDYSLGKRSMAYFAMHYRCIELAIEQGCEQLNFCQSTYPFKIEMGCQLQERAYMIKHRNPLMHWLLKCSMPYLFGYYRRLCGLPG